MYLDDNDYALMICPDGDRITRQDLLFKLVVLIINQNFFVELQVSSGILPVGEEYRI
jgi:hypothetical protein